MKRCETSDLPGMLDFYRLVIRETADIAVHTLRFDRMNTVQSETMALAEGDALHVSWQIESGRVDIAIGIKGEEAIYRADDRPAGDKADFYVEIPQTGSYTITVSAREAKGQIEFMRTENEQREGE